MLKPRVVEEDGVDLEEVDRVGEEEAVGVEVVGVEVAGAEETELLDHATWDPSRRSSFGKVSLSISRRMITYQ